MIDETAIGVPGTHPLAVSLDEQTRLAPAVHEARRRLVGRPQDRMHADVLACPSCGEEVILLDQPTTFVVRDHRRVCAACGAQGDFVALYRAEADIGGEG